MRLSIAQSSTKLLVADATMQASDDGTGSRHGAVRPALTGANTMIGFRRNNHKGSKDGDKSKPPQDPPPKPAPPAVDDLYDTGDIAAPTPDRDDEQRDL
jgi:hypothetical protein